MRNFLENLGLVEYLPLFEKNSIDVGDLAGLTNDDLKELGIDSLGHRKKILAAANASSAPAAPTMATPVSPAVPTEERVFLDKKVSIVNGGVAAVKITSHRAILGEKTYSLQNIAAVEAFNDRAIVEQFYHQEHAKWRSNTAARDMRILGVIAIVIGLAVIVGDTKATGGSLMCCIGPGLLLIFTAKSPPEPQLGTAVWSVRIQSSGTSNDVIQSLDESEIRTVVDALNKAITNLRV